MGKITGFKEYTRQLPKKKPVEDRLKDYREFVLPFPEAEVKHQASRCMDCGVPFCHTGCPLGNIIPDWNDLVYRGRWQEAIARLHATNNFPEFTGRLCPAPCEEACVLGINEPPVTIEQMEKEIIEKAFSEGWVKAEAPSVRTGKRVAVIGSGPAGLACAQQLNRAGHTVVVYERDDRVGGLLRYGIPDFKMEKWVIDRRLEIMTEEGIEFQTGIQVGTDLTADDLAAYDAVILCCGSTRPRDLTVPGRDLEGVHFAMEFLPQQNRVVAGDTVPGQISATGKHVIVIGGGDTGSDCVGTSNRHGAASVTQFELMPMPPEHEDRPLTWPYWPVKLRTSSSHQEGCEREFAIATKAFVAGSGRDKGRVKNLRTVRVQWEGGRMAEVPGSERDWKADLVLLAMGFTHPAPTVLDAFGVERDVRGNARAGTDDESGYATNVPKVFAAGDMRRGQSLVVWAIREGRQAAREVDRFLMRASTLPR